VDLLTHPSPYLLRAALEIVSISITIGSAIADVRICDGSNIESMATSQKTTQETIERLDTRGPRYTVNTVKVTIGR
jgi:hypothetical protein